MTLPLSSLTICLRILVYVVIYDSGYVSLEHFLLSGYPSRVYHSTGTSPRTSFDPSNIP